MVTGSSVKERGEPQSARDADLVVIWFDLSTLTMKGGVVTGVEGYITRGRDAEILFATQLTNTHHWGYCSGGQWVCSRSGRRLIMIRARDASEFSVD